MDSVSRLPQSRLIVEPETEAETAQPTTQAASEAQREWEAVRKALALLSHRVVAAMGHWLSFIVVLIAAALWWRVMDAPNTYQLVGLGLYGVFALAIVVVKGR